MSLDHSFTNKPVRDLPLQVFLQQEHSRFVAEPGRLLKPLIESLDAIHQSGRPHGAVTPGSIMVSPSGEIDLEFFKARAGSPDPVEVRTYYPDGVGDSLETRCRRDLQALGGVFHFIVADQAPASPSRRVQRLSDQPSAKNWPAGFIVRVDGLLATNAEAVLPTLIEVSASLDPVMPTEDPAVTPAISTEAASEDFVATPVIPAIEEVVEEPVLKVEDPPSPAAKQIAPIRLPNAMVGRSFSANIAAGFSAGSPAAGRVECLPPLPDGLQLNDDLLVGTPETAGEFDIQIRFHPSSTESGRPVRLDRTASLTINPDPRSLWKNLPSNETGEFWKPDCATDFLPDGPLTVLGASLRGRSHAHVGGFRDDDMAIAWYPAHSWYSLTVADGAGSAKYSRQGSKIACDSVKGRLAEYFSAVENPLSRLLLELAKTADVMPAVRSELYNLFGTAALHARKTIEDQALTIQATSRDFHTTLITALLHPLDDGSWFVATFSIGDGAAAVVSTPSGAPCLLTRPDGGDYAGQTVFLTINEALATGEAIMNRIQTAIIREFEALILVTDGISDPRFESEAALADPAAWSALWDELKLTMNSADSLRAAASGVLKWMEFHSPGHHDDRTLVLAARSPNIFKP